jgi:hypothetical protein
VYRATEDSLLIAQCRVSLEWSSTLLLLAPQSEASRATRGGVLVETERYHEARALLWPVALNGQDSMQRLMSQLFLGVAEQRLGNTAEAIRWFWETRRGLARTSMPAGFFERLLQAEEEIKSRQTPAPTRA